jgi:hypothetical protein
MLAIMIVTGIEYQLIRPPSDPSQNTGSFLTFQDDYATTVSQWLLKIYDGRSQCHSQEWWWCLGCLDFTLEAEQQRAKLKRTMTTEMEIRAEP